MYVLWPVQILGSFPDMFDVDWPDINVQYMRVSNLAKADLVAFPGGQ